MPAFRQNLVSRRISISLSSKISARLNIWPGLGLECTGNSVIEASNHLGFELERLLLSSLVKANLSIHPRPLPFR